MVMRRFEKNRTGIGSVAAFLLSAAACSQVLGIEEARIDPGLVPPSTTGGIDATSGGSGGSTSVDSGGTGGAGGGTIDSGGGAPDVGPDSGDSPTCRQYCSDVMDYCPGDTKQYVDAAQCLKACAMYPEGLITDADGNTASCRLKYAGKARYALGTERDAYCRKAGPGSEGTCGSICDGFCTLMMAACTPKFAPYNFPSLGDCMNACRILKDSPPYTVSDGTLPDRNDAQCRLFHVCSAVMDPDEHCEHAMGVTMCDPKSDAAAHGDH
jgi:hypothetical protein